MEKIYGRKLNKRGSLQDILLLGVIGLVFALILLIGFKFMDEFNTQVQGMDDIPTEAKTASTTLLNYYPTLMDNMFLFLVVGLGIAAIVLASLVRVHPVFIGLYLIALIIVIILAGVFSNMYTEIAADPQLSGLAAQLVTTSLFMTYWPIVIGVLGSIMAIIMYKQWQNG